LDRLYLRLPQPGAHAPGYQHTAPPREIKAKLLLHWSISRGPVGPKEETRREQKVNEISNIEQGTPIYEVNLKS